MQMSHCLLPSLKIGDRRKQKLFNNFLCIIVILTGTIVFPVFSECKAESPVEVKERLEKEIRLFGYVIACVKNQVNAKMLDNFLAKDMAIYFDRKYKPYGDLLERLGVDSRTFALNIQLGVANAALTDGAECKRNIDYLIASYNKLGIHSAYLQQALRAHK